MTEYLVLRFADHSDPSNADFWEVVGTVQARSARSAIQKHQEEWREGGTFAAVPARSWKPVTVKVETKTALKFS